METDEPSNIGKAEPTNWSAYKRAQVRCKQQPAEDINNLPGLVDFCRCQDHDDRIVRLNIPQHDDDCDKDKNNNNNNNNNSSKETELYHGPIYGIMGFPGVVMCPQALSKELQIQLAFAAVTEYCEAPHATNIDLVPPKASEAINRLPEETMWNLWKLEHGFANNHTHSGLAKTDKTKHYKSFRKLSWATMGYQYDWTARAYHEGAKSPMPLLLGKLATLFARTSLTVSNNNKTATESTLQNTSFLPSASIVNYYSTRSVMGGHRDDLEFAMDKPVVSISMGLPAIFLLGGKTKEEMPVLPILIRPGDVLMLGGDSRLNFHGMAKMIPCEHLHAIVPNSPEIPLGSLPTESQQLTLGHFSTEHGSQVREEGVAPDENDRKALLSFLEQHRININVRQVHKDK